MGASRKMRSVSDEVVGSQLYVVQSLEPVTFWLPAFGARTVYEPSNDWQCPALRTTLGASTTPEQGSSACCSPGPGMTTAASG